MQQDLADDAARRERDRAASKVWIPDDDDGKVEWSGGSEAAASMAPAPPPDIATRQGQPGHETVYMADDPPPPPDGEDTEAHPERRSETGLFSRIRAAAPTLPLIALVLVLPALVAVGARLALSWTHVVVDEALAYPDGSVDLVTAMAWGGSSDPRLFVGLRSGRVLAVDRSGGSEVVVEQGEFDASDSGAVSAPVTALDFSSGNIPHARVQARDANGVEGPVSYFSDTIEAADGLFAAVEANGGSAVAGFRPTGAFAAQESLPDGAAPLGLRLYRDIARGSDLGPTEVGEIFGIDDVRVVAALPGTSTVIAGTGSGAVHAIDASAQISGTSPETYQRRIGDHIGEAGEPSASVLATGSDSGAGSAVVGITVAAAPDPSGVLFATHGEDHSIKVWRGSVNRGSELMPLGEYQALDVSAVGSRWEASSINPSLFGGPGTNEGSVGDLFSISADGRRVLLGISDIDLRILDIAAAEDTGSSTAYSDISNGGYGRPAILSPDGQRLLALNRTEDTVEMLDLSDVASPGRPLPVLATFDTLTGRGVTYLEFDAAGRRFVAITQDRAAFVVDSEAPVDPVPIQTPQGRIVASAFSPDGTLVALSLAQGWIVVSDATTGLLIATLRGNIQPPATDLSFSSSGKQLHAVIGIFESIETYSIRRQILTSEQRFGDFAGVNITAFSEDGARHLSITGGALRILDPESRREIAEPIPWNFSPRSLRASDGARVIAALDQQGRLQILREYPDPERDGQPPLVADGGLLLSADGLTLVARDRLGDLHHASLDQSKSPVLKFARLNVQAAAMQVDLSPDGSELAIAGRDGTVRIARVTTLLPAGAAQPQPETPPAADVVVTGHGAPLGAMAMSPDGEFLATASLDGRLRMTRLGATRFVQSLPLAMLPAGRTAAPEMSPAILLGRDLVMKIQQGLGTFGSEDLPVDGIVGPRTRSAIVAFQEQFGLPVTGAPDLETYRKMIEIGLIEADRVQLPAPPPAAN